MGRKRKKTLYDESLEDNMDYYVFYLKRFEELSIAMFEWKNLPDSVDPRFLEETLFMNGSAVFFLDTDLERYTGLSEPQTETGTYLTLPVAMNGQWDVYNVPTNRRAYASNNYQKDLDQNNSVIIFNNMIRTNSVDICTTYAKRLWNLDAAIMINANAQKTPILIQATEPQRLTMLNLYKEYNGNQPFIFGDKNLDLNGIKALNTEAPYVADRLYELKTRITNEALTYLGISNVSYQKKERLISDEVSRSMGGTIANRYSRLNARREAAKQINDMFGLNIEVDFREDYNLKPNETEDDEPDDLGGEEDE